MPTRDLLVQLFSRSAWTRAAVILLAVAAGVALAALTTLSGEMATRVNGFGPDWVCAQQIKGGPICWKHAP